MREAVWQGIPPRLRRQLYLTFSGADSSLLMRTPAAAKAGNWRQISAQLGYSETSQDPANPKSYL